MIPRHREFLSKSLTEREEILAELEQLKDTILESNVTSNAKLYYRMARSVSREIHYHKMFTRLKIHENAILSGIIQPQHAIEDILLKFFYQRFPKFIIILYSRSKKRTYFIAPIELKKLLKNKGILFKSVQNYIIGKSKLDLKKLLLILIPLAKGNELFNGVLDANLDLNKLFKEFYNSQYIDSRENFRLFFQNMPKKYQNKKDMVVEKTFHTRTLDKFMKK
jgi:hypothetical protein